ncbi:porin OmpA [Aeromonas veronii]|nr:porin OmpA [Aeromonas veronii]
MMKMAPSMIAIAMAALGATAAHAADDIYFGAGVGAAHFNGLSKVSNSAGEENAAAANAFVGYNYTENFGTEFGYQYAGRGNSDGQRYENQGATLSGIARLPVGNDFSLFAEGGAYWAHTDGLGISDTKVSPLAGAGVTYKVNDALDLQARYRYMWDVADLNVDGSHYKSNQSVATLEAVYHPFRTSYVAPVAAPVVEEAPAPAPQVVEKNFALNSDVLFAFGKETLKPEGVAALNALYQQIVDFQPKDGNAVVVGYTDRIGSDAYNQKLSEARARTVANFLVSKGMAASKVAIEGRGEANPVTGTKCNGVTAKAQLISCLAPDRRVEVRVSGVQEVQK